MPCGERGTGDVEPRAIDPTERRVQAEALLAEDGILPRLQRGEHLRRKCLVDLKYACTRQPRSAAYSSEQSSTTDAPSVSGVELPAVIVAAWPRPKTGFSFESLSTEVSGRRF